MWVSAVVAHGLSRFKVGGILPSQIEPMSPALHGRFLTTGPPGKSLKLHLDIAIASCWLVSLPLPVSLAHHTGPSLTFQEKNQTKSNAWSTVPSMLFRCADLIRLSVSFLNYTASSCRTGTVSSSWLHTQNWAHYLPPGSVSVNG